MTLDEGMTVNVQYNQFDSGAGTPKIRFAPKYYNQKKKSDTFFQ